MVKMLMLFANPMNERLQVSSINSTTLITQHNRHSQSTTVGFLTALVEIRRSLC